MPADVPLIPLHARDRPQVLKPRLRAVVQRVTSARVTVDDRVTGEIGAGLLVLLGVEQGDGPADVQYIASKIRDLRIFADDAGKMNLSVLDRQGARAGRVAVHACPAMRATAGGRRSRRRRRRRLRGRSTKMSCEN